MFEEGNDLRTYNAVFKQWILENELTYELRNQLSDNAEIMKALEL